MTIDFIDYNNIRYKRGGGIGIIYFENLDIEIFLKEEFANELNLKIDEVYSFIRGEFQLEKLNDKKNKYHLIPDDGNKRVLFSLSCFEGYFQRFFGTNLAENILDEKESLFLVDLEQKIVFECFSKKEKGILIFDFKKYPAEFGFFRDFTPQDFFKIFPEFKNFYGK